jgi:hypothetical protein
VEGRRPGMADEGGGDRADVTGDVETVIPDAEAVISDADADVLIAEAVQRREDQQSGRSMGRQLWLVAGCAIAGLLLIAVGGFLGQDFLGHGLAGVTLAVGVLVLALAGLLLLRALDLSPVTQWGEPVGEPCSACGERNLREDRVAVPEANGIVALCTPECGYAEVRPDPDGAPDPHGSPDAGSSRTLWNRLTRRA